MPVKKETSFFSSRDSPWETRIAYILEVCLYVAMAFVVVMTLLTVVHAVGRYGFKEPIRGLMEMSCFMLIIIIFLSGAYTQVVKGHVSVGLIVDRFSKRTQAIIDSVTYIISLAVVIVAFWQSLVRGMNLIGSGYVTAALGIPHFPFPFVMAFGWAIFALAILMHLIHFLPRAFRGPKQ